MAKKENIRPKREIFNHKYYYVIRRKGKIVDRKKYNNDFMKKDAYSIFKANGSLRSDKEVLYLERVNEISTIQSKLNIDDKKTVDNISIKDLKGKRINKGKPQAFAKITFNGHEVVGRSKRTDYKISVEQAKEDALNNALAIIGKDFGGSYDDDAGRLYLKSIKNVKIKMGVIYYSRA